MDYSALLQDLLLTVIIPLLGVLTTYFVKWLNLKMENLKIQNDNDLHQKYITLLNNTITDCVLATTQTYVESLKNNGAFTPEAQKTAFNMTYQAVMNVLTEDAKEYLKNVLGDLDAFVTNAIEAQVQMNKQV